MGKVNTTYPDIVDDPDGWREVFQRRLAAGLGITVEELRESTEKNRGKDLIWPRLTTDPVPTRSTTTFAPEEGPPPAPKRGRRW